MSKILRRTLGILLIALVVLAMGALAVRQYFRSRRVADHVAAQIKTIYKGDVELGGVDVGIGSTSLNNLKFMETASKTPWFEVQELYMDVSILDFLQGNSMPGKIKLTGAKLLLRFGRDGKLLTALPESFTEFNWENPHEAVRFDAVPAIEFEKSQVTIQTEGAPDQIFEEISGKLDKNTNELVLEGSAASALWGKWAITGLLHKQSARINVQFTSQAAIHVTQTMLEQLPFIPEWCWREVRIDRFDTPAVVQVDYDLKTGDRHCQAELEPARAHFHIAALGMNVADAHGKIVLDENQLLLRDLQGNAFGGRLALNAVLTVHADSIRIDSRIEAKRLEVSQFPPAWGLAPDMSGKLTGIAALKVLFAPANLTAPNIAATVGLMASPCTVDVSPVSLMVPFETVVQTAGAGKGQIVDAVVGRVRAGSIDLELHAVPRGFRFGRSGS